MADIRIGYVGDLYAPEPGDSPISNTEALRIFTAQDGEDVSADQDGILSAVRLRLGGPAAHVRFLIATGELVADTYTVRDVTGELEVDTDGDDETVYVVPVSLAVKAGDFLSLYGITPGVGDGDTIIMYRDAEGTYRQDFSSPPVPVVGASYVLNPTDDRVRLGLIQGLYDDPPSPGSPVIGATGLETQHPDEESDVDVTGVLLLVDSQVGNDVTSTERGFLNHVAIRLGGSAGAGQNSYLITTGTLGGLDGNEYTVRDVMAVVGANDGSGTTVYKFVGSPGPAVEPGDYIGVYGIDPVPDGYIPTMVVDNAAQGTYRQDAPASTPEPGDVLTVSFSGSPGMPLLCSPWPPEPPPEPSSDCACAEDFRFEAADLRTGIVKAILEPTAADWQTTLNAVGQGSLSLTTKAIRARDIWPHLTSVYCLRTSGGTATPENPVVEGAYIIEKFTAADTGQTQVGMKSIEDYLWHRILRSDLAWDGSPTALAAVLVNTTTGNGIPLTGDSDTSAENTDREYFAYDRKNIGEAINELVEAEPGIEWEVVHTKSPGGAWSSTVVFRDQVGAVRALVLQSDVEGAGYGLDVDAAEHANLVDAIGEGSEDDQLIATAIDTGTYPQFDAAPAFKDINILPTLQQQADGYLTDHREPVAVPSMTVMGTADPDPALLRNGDVVERVRTNFGALSYDGPARIVATSWALRLGAPPARTYQFLSTGRASQTVLNQDITDDCPDCED